MKRKLRQRRDNRAYFTSEVKINHQKLTLSSFIIFSIILLDQITKALVLRFGVSHACNMGFAFGIWQGFLNGLVAVLVLLVVVYFFLTSSYSSSPSAGSGREVSSFALALIIGGGLSNIVDRLTRGCVIDFIDLKVWPAFNLADAAISVGTGILILSLLKDLRSGKHIHPRV